MRFMTYLQIFLLNTEGKLKAKPSTFCNGPVESHHLHLTILKVIP